MDLKQKAVTTVDLNDKLTTVDLNEKLNTVDLNEKAAEHRGFKNERLRTAMDLNEKLTTLLQCAASELTTQHDTTSTFGNFY